MAFLCQRHDGNLLFPHPRPSPATTVFVFGTSARAGEGGRWPSSWLRPPTGVGGRVVDGGLMPTTGRQLGVPPPPPTGPHGGRPQQSQANGPASAGWWNRARCERRPNTTGVPRGASILRRCDRRPASSSTRGRAADASTLWLTPHVRLAVVAPPGPDFWRRIFSVVKKTRADLLVGPCVSRRVFWGGCRRCYQPQRGP
jgi:hypothetical protein